MSDCFLVDLAPIQFSEGDTTKWIHALSPGEYDHPLKGKLKFTAERIQRFADNVKNKVRGIDPDIDYDHKEKVNDAAGWVKDAEARPDGLWLLVEFTKTGFQKIIDKEYRYFSSDYSDVWTDPKTGQEYQDVLNGGGLTNRPFLKDLRPINLSEVLGGNSMNPELLKLLGLPEDADEATVLAKAKELAEAASVTDPPSPDGPVEPAVPPVPPTNPDPAPTAPVVDDKPANDPVTVAMNDRIEALEAELRHRDVVGVVTQLSEGGSYTIAPTMLDEVKSLALNSPKELGNKWLDLVKKIKDEGIVQLGEVGVNPEPGSSYGDDTATVKLNKRAEVIMLSEKDLTFADAFVRASTESPELTRQYRNETYLKEGA